MASDEQLQNTAVQATFDAAENQIRAAGAAKAQEAAALGTSIPLSYSGDALNAARKAAVDTANTYAAHLPEQMSATAGDVQSHVGTALGDVRQIAKAARDELNQQVKLAHTALQNVQKQSLESADHTRDGAIKSIDAQSKVQLAMVASLGASSIAGIRQQASTAAANVTSAAQKARASFTASCNKGADGYEAAAHAIVETAHKLDDPQPTEMHRTVEKNMAELRTGFGQLMAGLRKGAEMSSGGLTSTGTQAAGGIASAGAAAIGQAASIGAGAADSLKKAADATAQRLTQVSQQTKQTIDQASQAAGKSFDTISGATEKTYSNQVTQLQQGLSNTVANAEQQLGQLVPGKETGDILAAAKKAADATHKSWWDDVCDAVSGAVSWVADHWQDILKVVVKVVVAVAVFALVTVLTGGLGDGILIAVLAGGLMGAAGAVTDKMVDNVFDGKGPFDGMDNASFWGGVAISAGVGALTGGIMKGVSLTAVGGKLLGEEAPYLSRFAINGVIGGGTDYAQTALTTGKVWPPDWGALAKDILITAATESGPFKSVTEAGSNSMRDNVTNPVRTKLGLDPLPHMGETSGGSEHSTQSGHTSDGGGDGSSADAGHASSTADPATAPKSADAGHAPAPQAPGKGSSTSDATAPQGTAPDPAAAKSAASDPATQRGTAPDPTKPAPEAHKTTAPEPTKPAADPATQKTTAPEPTKPVADPATQKTTAPEPTKPAADAHQTAATDPNKTAADPSKSGVDPGKVAADQSKASADANKTSADPNKASAEPGKTGGTHKADDPAVIEPAYHSTPSVHSESAHEAPVPNVLLPAEAPGGANGEDAGAANDAAANDPANDQNKKIEGELDDLGYPAADPNTFNKAITDLEAARTPRDQNLRDTEANRKGLKELQQLEADPNKTIEEKARFNRDLAARLREEPQATGNLDKAIKDVNRVEKSADNERGTAGEKAKIGDGKTGPEAQLDRALLPEALRPRYDQAWNFYKEQGMAEYRISNHLKGIDFAKPLEVVTISKGTVMQQYQVKGGPQGDYYADSGTTADSLGINPDGEVRSKDGKPLEVVQKDANLYVANKDVQVLKSTSAEIDDTWSVTGKPYHAGGGGTQFFTTNRGAFTPVKAN